MNGIGFFESIWQDARYSLRTLRATPGFAVTAVLALALGIAGNTTMFTVIRAMLLKPLAYPKANRLVRLSLENRRGGERNGSISPMRLAGMRASAKSFSGIGAYLKFVEDMSLSGIGGPQALKGARVSANFLDILGVKPIVGRGFLAEEDMPAGPPVAMIGATLWKRRFASNPQLAAKAVTLNSIPYTIVGVLPEGFSFPFSGIDVWVTKPADWSVLPPRFWDLPILFGFARVKPRVSFDRARAELDVLNRQYVLAHPNLLDAKAGVSMRMASLKDQLVANVRPTLWMLFGAVGFVLLIACANVASLLLARGASRSGELAVRTAVGAPPERLIRQLLVESLVLAIAGGGLGVLLAQWALSAIKQVGVLNLPRVAEVRLDGEVLAFTVALSFLTGICFGLFPSLKASRVDLAYELRESGAGSGRGSFARRNIFGLTTRALLVMGQIALSIVLLIGATLLLKSFARLRHVDPGFQAANLLTMKVALPPARYDTDRKKSAFFREVARRIQGTQGVVSAAVAMSIPTSLGWLGTNVLVEGQPMVDGEKQPTARLQSITPGYFHTLGIPLLRGREFTALDNTPGAPPAVIVNESFVRQFWPAYPRGPDPIGRHLREGIDHTGWIPIVGIVADVHEGDLTSGSGPEFYVPTVIHPPQTAYLIARTGGDPLHFGNAMRTQVRAVDPDQPVSDVRTMEAVLDATLGERRLTMLLLASFASVALLLAILGIYGTIAYSVAQRTHEVGIRRALGAQHADILRLVLGQGLLLALSGVAIGICVALALTRVIRNLLFEVSATDPAIFIGMAALFICVALAASYLPARRAARIDPINALRVG